MLPPTRGTDKGRIRTALDRLQAGGSTAGAAGIRLAYRVARESYLEDGVNRVILATDGDFDVGVSSDGELMALYEVVPADVGLETPGADPLRYQAPRQPSAGTTPTLRAPSSFGSSRSRRA